MKLKKKHNRKNIIIVIILLVIVFSFFLLYLYDKKISISLIKYAKIESKKIGIDIVSKNVSDEVVRVLDKNNIFELDKDNNGNIEMINYNTKVVNEVLGVASKTVIKNFDILSKKKDNIITRIPMGMVTNNLFLENLGPKVPVRLNLVGNVLTSLKTRVKEYGMNSALVEISIRIEANVEILVPLRVEQIKIVNEVPISIKIVEGNVSSLLSSYN